MWYMETKKLEEIFLNIKFSEINNSLARFCPRNEIKVSSLSSHSRRANHRRNTSVNFARKKWKTLWKIVYSTKLFLQKINPNCINLSAMFSFSTLC